MPLAFLSLQEPSSCWQENRWRIGCVGGECHGLVVSVSGHFMEPLLESDVGDDERCSRQEVALRRNEVQ